MNAKELEALVIAVGEQLQASETGIKWLRSAVDQLQVGRDEDRQAHMHLVQRAVTLEWIKAELATRDERIRLLEELHDARRNEIEGLTARIEELTQTSHEFRSHQDGMNDTLFGTINRIEKLETLVLARNASAATKRNMTDEDALRVLTGDLREVAHKEAAEKIGLTYAQVYSCRLEFTFKHVHKDLRDNVKDWKNPWNK